ncbi:hypothetical protein MKW94_019303 [Papaver nudicaule]|uniref:Transcription repressor n=1 Tax=Papaver nudicaule TaxID=74823 RepID=A0AA41VJF4_PAPNU|nr:hypothetical protein [Papaver nudicaule]MCL7042845.1 hypothetical protein [Papaver nudicaule]
MSSSNRRRLLQNTIAVNVGCSCRKLKLADIFRRRPNRIIKASTTTTTSSSTSTVSKNKKKKKSHLCNSSTSLSTLSLNDEEDDDSNTTFGTTPHYYSSEPEPTTDLNKKVKGFGRINESLAIEKDSDDPYVDFRHSMLQMILEKEIYSVDGLRQLLQCFLSLNSPYHHEIIIQVFTEIWNGVFSVKPYNY